MNYLKLTIAVFCCLLCACGNWYTDPAKINTADYTAALQELKDKKITVESLIPQTTVETKLVILSKLDFNGDLKKSLPKCYELLKTGKAVEIYRFNDDCASFVLKIEDGIFNTERECLLANQAADCGMFTEGYKLIKKAELKKGWTYKVVSQYTAD